MQPFGYNRHGPKIGALSLFCGELWKLCPPSNTISNALEALRNALYKFSTYFDDWADAYLRTKWHLDPSSRLATIHGPKWRAAVPPFLGEMGPI